MASNKSKKAAKKRLTISMVPTTFYTSAEELRLWRTDEKHYSEPAIFLNPYDVDLSDDEGDEILEINFLSMPEVHRGIASHSFKPTQEIE